MRGTGLRIGDFCLAINMMDGRFSYAVYADAKRQPNLGESSMRLVDNLGLPSDRQGGATRGVDVSSVSEFRDRARVDPAG